jgi:hypothetical protein
MNSKILAALLIAASATLAAPAFASGYGPAPSYRPVAGAPSSQRGPSAQTVAAEHNDAAGSFSTTYGGAADASSQAGSPQPTLSSRDSTNSH